MKSIKSKNKKNYPYKILFFFFISFFNILEINSTENKNKGKISSQNFEEVYFKNSISYEAYDSYSYQLKKFFGIDYNLPEAKKYYKDISMENDSKNLRELYKAKFKEMILIKKNNTETFYNNKL